MILELNRASGGRRIFVNINHIVCFEQSDDVGTSRVWLTRPTNVSTASIEVAISVTDLAKKIWDATDLMYHRK